MKLVIDIPEPIYEELIWRDYRMTSKSFGDYQEACIFNDKVNGQIQGCSYKHKKYWVVWY